MASTSWCFVFAAAEEADDDIAAEGNSIEDEINYVDSGVDEFNHLESIQLLTKTPLWH